MKNKEYINGLDLYEIARLAHDYIKDFGFTLNDVEMRKDKIFKSNLSDYHKKKSIKLINEIHERLYELESIFVSKDKYISRPK